ncbi:MAG: hypothetical protein [Olavius algarvensis Gamma 1 endosymbiont]|nr:MAG: hypothetical protein [Olavius algarvensis Gamma 1 endosymbiont]
MSCSDLQKSYRLPVAGFRPSSLRDCLKIKLLILSYKFCVFWRFYTVFPRILL